MTAMKMAEGENVAQRPPARQSKGQGSRHRLQQLYSGYAATAQVSNQHIPGNRLKAKNFIMHDCKKCLQAVVSMVKCFHNSTCVAWCFSFRQHEPKAIANRVLSKQQLKKKHNFKIITQSRSIEYFSKQGNSR